MRKTFRRQLPSTPVRSRLICRQHSVGLTKIEILISASLLAVVMSVTATMFHQINLVWKDVRHHRIATGELANQLDVLTRIEVSEVEMAIDALKPSEICSNALPNSTLTGSIVKDSIGDRIDLEIQWRSRHASRTDAHPNRARLSGWLIGGSPQ